MKYNIVNSGIVVFFPDAYSRDYVKLAWMEPPVERSGDDLHIADYHKVSFKNSIETHYGGDFGRKFFFLVSRMLFSSCFWYVLGFVCVYQKTFFFNIKQKKGWVMTKRGGKDYLCASYYREVWHITIDIYTWARFCVIFPTRFLPVHYDCSTQLGDILD